jgi:hypothetical protein
MGLHTIPFQDILAPVPQMTVLEYRRVVERWRKVQETQPIKERLSEFSFAFRYPLN